MQHHLSLLVDVPGERDSIIGDFLKIPNSAEALFVISWAENMGDQWWSAQASNREQLTRSDVPHKSSWEKARPVLSLISVELQQ